MPGKGEAYGILHSVVMGPIRHNEVLKSKGLNLVVTSN